MKEDVLEQIVDDYLQFKGGFTTHNVRFKPSPDHPECPVLVVVEIGDTCVEYEHRLCALDDQPIDVELRVVICGQVNRVSLCELTRRATLTTVSHLGTRSATKRV
jgi:hypothetical protein